MDRIARVFVLGTWHGGPDCQDVCFRKLVGWTGFLRCLFLEPGRVNRITMRLASGSWRGGPDCKGVVVLGSGKGGPDC